MEGDVLVGEPEVRVTDGAPHWNVLVRLRAELVWTSWTVTVHVSRHLLTPLPTGSGPPTLLPAPVIVVGAPLQLPVSEVVLVDHPPVPDTDELRPLAVGGRQHEPSHRGVRKDYELVRSEETTGKTESLCIVIFFSFSQVLFLN